MKNRFFLFTSIITTLTLIQPALAFEPVAIDPNTEVTITSPFNTDSLPSTTGLQKDETAAEPTFMTDEVLVKYKDDKIDLDTSAGRARSLQFANANALDTVKNLEDSNISILRITDNTALAKKIEALEQNPNVEYSQPNFQYSPTAIATNDTFRQLLWGLDNTGQTVGGFYPTNAPLLADKDIDAPEAWVINEGTAQNVIVAVIDTGVAYNHPDLLANMWDGSACKDDTGAALGGCNYGYDFEDNDNDPLPTTNRPFISHGTHVAGTIAAVKNNGKGVIGVAPRANIMALKSSLSTFEIVRAINFAKHNGATVINASWTGPYFDPVLRDAIASFPGLFVTAAGNQGTNNAVTPSYPSDFDLDSIISVAATDRNDTLATFSSYGLASVDVGAPGTNIYSTVPSAPVAALETFDTVTVPNVPSGWTTNGTSSNWGTYQLDNGEFWGKVLDSAIATPYASSSNTSITSPTYNLRSAAATINFWAVCDTEYDATLDDYMAIEVSGDNGTTFSGLNLGGTWGTSNGEFNERSLDQDDNPAGGSLHFFQNINIPVQYLTENFKLRFRWVTNEADNNYAGCMIDDIELTKFSDGANEKYAYISGTSMATPHVTGLAALIAGYNPNLTSTQIKNIILSSGDSIPSLAGKTVSGKRINAENALRAASPAKAITAFTIPTQVGTTTINEVARTITLTVPAGTALSALTPTITITGASVNPPSGAAQNFSAPVPYTVTASDSSTETYLVTVTADSGLDTTPPVITLLGENPLPILLGQIFIDPGATAIDNADGDVTNRIVATGTVSTVSGGSYTVRYTVTDAAGNSATKDRVVVVSALSLSPATVAAVTQSSATINWTTSHPATSRVLFDTVTRSNASTTIISGPNYGYGNSTAQSSTLTSNHGMTLSALIPETTYFIRPVSSGSSLEKVGAELSFTTPASPAISSTGGGGGGGGSTKSKIPSYAVSINNGAAQATSTQVVLTITPVPNSTQLQVSNTPNFSSATWLPFQSPYLWTLTTGSGSKTVYIRYGKNGRVLGTAQDTISLREAISPAPTAPTLGSQPTPLVPFTPPGQVLGATSNTFATVLTVGSSGTEVTALQKVLMAGGHLKIPAPTGYYGAITKVAVEAYQRANNLEPNGIVGPSTQAVLNQASPVLSNEQRLLLIKTLLAKIQELQALLAKQTAG